MIRAPTLSTVVRIALAIVLVVGLAAASPAAAEASQVVDATAQVTAPGEPADRVLQTQANCGQGAIKVGGECRSIEELL